jgi:hypothetical protein
MTNTVRDVVAAHGLRFFMDIHHSTSSTQIGDEIRIFEARVRGTEKKWKATDTSYTPFLTLFWGGEDPFNNIVR